MTIIRVVLLVAGILALLTAIMVPLLLWVRKRTRRLVAEMGEQLAASGERIVLGPAPGMYRGGTGGFPRVKGNAVLALTDRRLACSMVVGKPFDVPLDKLASVREDKWFLSAYRSGCMHLILQLSDDTAVGFIVNDHGRWMEAVRQAVSTTATS